MIDAIAAARRPIRKTGGVTVRGLAGASTPRLNRNAAAPGKRRTHTAACTPVAGLSAARSAPMQKTLLTFVDDIYEDLSCGIRKLPEEAGSAPCVVKMEIKTHKGKHGYPAKSLSTFEKMPIWVNEPVVVDNNGNGAVFSLYRWIAPFGRTMVDFLKRERNAFIQLVCGWC